MISKKWLLCQLGAGRRARPRRRRMRRRRRGSDGGGGDTASGLSGTISIDGSSTVQPFAEAAAELFNEENPDVEHHRRRGRHQRRLREVLRRRDRHLRRLAADRARGGDALQEGRRRVHRGPGRQRRHLDRHQPGARDQLPDHRPARSSSGTDDTVTNYSELGEDADTGEPLPDAEVSLYGPGTDSGTFDYFTDAINGEEGVSRKEYQPSEDDNVLVQGVARRRAGSATSASPTTSRTPMRSTWSRSTRATAASRRARRRSRTARTRRSRGRCSCTRRARRSRQPEVGGVHAVRRRQLRHDRRGRADRPDGRDAGAARRSRPSTGRSASRARRAAGRHGARRWKPALRAAGAAPGARPLGVAPPPLGRGGDPRACSSSRRRSRS